MSTVIVPDDLARTLTDSHESCVQIVNSTGEVVGYFSTIPLPQYAVMDLPPPLSEEEITERMKGPWYTTEEVLTHLKSLE